MITVFDVSGAQTTQDNVAASEEPLPPRYVLCTINLIMIYSSD